MEAGYDFLLLRGRSPWLRLYGVLFVVVGALLLMGGGAYYAYASWARDGLDQLNVAVAPPPVANPAAAPSQEQSSPPTPRAQATPTPLPTAAKAQPTPNPLLAGFTPISPDQALPVGSQRPATRLIIPAIGVDSPVGELTVLNLGDSRAYETPNNMVGHIPETASAGEAGAAWFFGHLESPIQGQGSVFADLPRIPGLLKNGETVHVVTDNGVNQFLYRVTATKVVHQSQLRLRPNPEGVIQLVACVPSLVYDHRLIVTAELAGIK